MKERLGIFFLRHWALLIIVFLGAGARLFHLSFGVPDAYLEDEEFFINPALRVAEGLTHFSGWDPQWYGAPAAPLITLLAIIFRATNVIINMLHNTDFTVMYQFSVYPEIFVTAGRFVPAIAGIATILIIYAIGRLRSRAVGLWAAGIYASAFYPIQYAHIIRPDIVQTACILVCVYALMRIMSNPDNILRWYVVAAISFGLACTTKYPSVFLLPVIVSCIVIDVYAHRHHVRHFGVAVGIFVCTLFFSAPFLFIRFGDAFADIQFERATIHAEHITVSVLDNILWYLNIMVSWQLGTALMCVSGIGIYAMMKDRVTRDQCAVVVASGCVYLLGLSVQQLHWERWSIPLISLLCICAAYGMDILMRVFRIRIFFLFLIVCILYAPMLRTARTLSAYTQPHSLRVASEWVNEHVPSESKVIREAYTPQPSVAQLSSIANATYHSLRWYREHEIDYIFLGAVYERIMRLSERAYAEEHFVRAAAVYTHIIDHSRVVFTLEQYPMRCIFASDWEVFFASACSRPFFGEGQYVLQIR